GASIATRRRLPPGPKGMVGCVCLLPPRSTEGTQAPARAAGSLAPACRGPIAPAYAGPVACRGWPRCRTPIGRWPGDHRRLRLPPAPPARAVRCPLPRGPSRAGTRQAAVRAPGGGPGRVRPQRAPRPPTGPGGIVPAGPSGSARRCAAGALFVLGRLAHVEHAHVEVQGLPGQRVVAVDAHAVAVDLDHGDQQWAAFGAGFELHARLHLLHALERLPRQVLDQRLVAHAVALLRAHVHLQPVTRLVPGQRLLQAGDDVAGAVEVVQRTVFRRLVDDATFVVGQGVVDAGDARSRNLHGDPPWIAWGWVSRGSRRMTGHRNNTRCDDARPR